MSELGQQTVEFSSLVSRAAESSFSALKDLVEKSRSTEQSDSEKKISLLKYLVKTQQRMLRLNVLAKWCQQVPLIQYCQQLASTLSSHDSCFTQAADSLFFMHEGLQQACAPVYDVPSAIEVLLTGTYQRLPKCIENVGMQCTLTADQQKPALKKLGMLVRSKLLEVLLPKEISEVTVSDGTALLIVNGEFKVLVTLGYRGHLSMWRILHIALLVGEKNGPVKLEEMQRHVLGDDLERRMAAADNPFIILYSVLHELCVALVMDTVLRQVQTLRQGRWKNSIRFELISDASGGQASNGSSMQTNQVGEADWAGLRIPGLKIVYWLDFDRKPGLSDSGPCPFLKVEPGPDLQIKSLHSTFVVDPNTGKEAEFTLDLGCIDVEELLLKAITCHRYTRLLEIQKELSQNGQICRGAGDVVLQRHLDEPAVDHRKDGYKIIDREYEGQEVLCVRAHSSSFFILRINIRNGRFLLQSSRNIITPSALVDCEEALNQGTMTAADVFISLRSKSILHLFACIGQFLGLEVYGHGFSNLKVPKGILNGSNTLVMGFPDCKSSYFLLMQLDKDFKPLFNLLETQGDPFSNDYSSSTVNPVLCKKSVDIGEMQMLEDDLNLSLLDIRKLLSVLPDSAGLNPTSENGLAELGLESPMQIPGCCSTSFSSVVDEIFEMGKASSAFPSSSQNVASSFSPNPPHFGSMKMNPNVIMQTSQINNAARVSSGGSPYANSMYSTSNLKGTMQSNSASLLSCSGRSAAARKLPASKSDQDLASIRSPHSGEVSSCTSMDEDQSRLLNDSSKEVDTAALSSHLLSPPQMAGTRTVAPNTRPNGLRTVGPRAGSLKFSSSGTWVTAPVSQALDSVTCLEFNHDDASRRDKNSRKRSISYMLNLIPSLQGQEVNTGYNKRQKITDLGHTQQLTSQALLTSEMISKFEANSYGSLIAEANKGNAPSSVYVSALLHVVRLCSLGIKHARLTSQMEAVGIPYIEEVDLGNASSNLWFRVPSAHGDSWPHICLRLGKPGSMFWDVKINDQHFRDLWELQKGNNTTPWDSGVCIANTSDMDSHICYDSEGVLLSYHSVEHDSIKKLVADIQRLSNARMFALGMRKMLGARADEIPEDSSANSDRQSEQTRKVFRVEAVGLMSLWFSFGTGVVARFVVEWESCKEGCTMHVSPDQLWPHTKFLEEFINGGEISSLLDCIRLTSGPLHALAAASRPARASPAAGSPAIAGAISSISRQGLYTQSPGLSPVNPTPSAATQPAGGTLGSPVPPGGASHSLHGAAAALSAAGRGGPGLVPSSLLPIDVSVVLRGPYWIRIIYRKDFAVDMRCFAGDQVWLQPATPPKGGPPIGGSLPCPQFRPFIMEHVAQELSVLEPNFTSGQQVNPTSGPPSSASQQSAANGRLNPACSSRISRPGNPVTGLSRVMGSSSLAVAGSVRRPPGTAIPAHVRGEINTAIIGLGDDGGYGGGWVPLVALKKVLRGILKYLGVLWLFAQLPDLLKDILGSILNDNEGTLLNLDQEQPALRFFVGGYVFAVSVHRVQLLLQVISVKRFHHQQQQQNSAASGQEELTPSEISEICDYFSRRVASEPYDASRVASFITLLTLPISVLREFLKLIAWKKGLTQVQGGEIAPAQKPRIELCLENHAGFGSGGSKSNIHYDRPRNSVDFGLTLVLDPALIPHINVAGGAAWLPYCVSVRLRYSFGESPSVAFLSIEGSHGGRACWVGLEDWEMCRLKVSQTVEVWASSTGDTAQGRLKMVADNVQKTLHGCLRGLKEGVGAGSIGT